MDQLEEWDRARMIFLRSCVFILLVAAFLSSPFVQASSENRTPRTERRLLLKSIFCARDLVQHSHRPLPGKFLALDYLRRARAAVSDLATLSQNVSECEQTLSALRSGEIEKLDPGFERLRRRFADWISLPDHADYPGVTGGVQNLIEDFQLDEFGRSWSECFLLGPEVIAGLGIALSAGVNAGLCVQRDWRRWIAIGAQVGLGLGLGGAIGVHVEREVFKGGADVDYELVNGGFVLIGGLDGVEWDDEGSDPTFGAGLGAFVLGRMTGHTTLVPIGTHRRKILAEFMSDDSRNVRSGPRLRD